MSATPSLLSSADSASSRRRFLTLSAALAPLVWGTTYIVTTELLPPGRSMTASVIRSIPAGLILLAIAPGLPKAGWRLKTAVLAILNIGAFFPLLFIAASRLPGGTAAVVGSIQPLVIGAASTALGWGRPARKQMLWAIVAVVGVAFTTFTGSISIDPGGLIAATLGTVSMACGLMLTRRWKLPPDTSPLNSTAWQLIIGGTVIIPLIPLLDQRQWNVDLAAAAGYAWLTIVGGAAAYAVWLRGARTLPSTNMAFLGLLSPLTAAVLGWLLLAQSMTPLQSIGFLLALTGSIAGQSRGETADPSPYPPVSPPTQKLQPIHRKLTPLPEHANLSDALHDQVQQQPTAVAVVDGRQQLTFAQLWQQAGDVAAALQRSGVQRNDLVGIAMEPTATMTVAVWGILRAGAAYLPLAVDYPEERLSFMVSDARLRCIVTDPERTDTIADLVADDVPVVSAVDIIRYEADLLVEPHRDIDDLAYVIYTSGSTGRPKGVMITQRGISNQMSWLHDTIGLVPGRRILFKTPTSFDAAQWELLANAAGATVVVAPSGTHRDPRQICDLVQIHDVDFLQCVPTLWRALAARPELRDCYSLRHIFSGGEILSAPLAQQLLHTLPNADLTNLYGPTEATINATFHKVDPRRLQGGDSAIGIGGPVRGCSIYVLDDDLTPMDKGQVGELCIGGPQVAAGYLNRPQLTAERFVTLKIDEAPIRVYRTGDLARVRPDGTLDFCGRIDDQIKVNGHRIESDEIRLAIERHHWVTAAAVVPWSDGKDGLTRIAAFVQLDSTEAALMDQEHAGDHHRSKATHLQTRAQLGGLGIRTVDTATALPLPNPEGRTEQSDAAFARKTYRHYDGRRVAEDDLTSLGSWLHEPWPHPGEAQPLDRERLADVLRWLGPFHSSDRLLPKYAYASPGALNGTQIYLELAGIPGLPDGLFYYHPYDHALHRLGATTPGANQRFRIHLVGLPRVIESVYTDNVAEVLHLEAGHIIGVLDRALAEHGSHLTTVTNPTRPDLGLNEAAINTATLDVTSGEDHRCEPVTPELLIQVHAHVDGLRRGTYRYASGAITRISHEVIERRHVVAINQATYDRSSFGVALMYPEAIGWDGYLQMGRALQKLQMNDRFLGLMSSGYSSLTGRNLPSANRLNYILADRDDTDRYLSYFAVGGAISHEQLVSTGMKEDAVHMGGPQEILREDLRKTLPHYMVPARVELVETIPQSTSGKVDRAQLIRSLDQLQQRTSPVIAPRTPMEVDIANIWSTLLDVDNPSTDDDFFDTGGDSLAAVELVHALNNRFNADLPVQTVFDAPTINDLAARIGNQQRAGSRIVALAAGTGQPIYIWPGLGGYPMNLRHLANAIANGRPAFGIQTHGLNPGETPYTSLREMIHADGQAILDHSDFATVTLVGYSFGARVASETAAWLDLHGIDVDRILLLAPGSPTIPGIDDGEPDAPPDHHDTHFRKILASVFLGSLGDALVDRALDAVHDKETFLEFVQQHVPGFNLQLASRIVDVVTTTYQMRSAPTGPLARRINRTHVLTARGDRPSFIDTYRTELQHRHAIAELEYDHYQLLHEHAVAQVAMSIRSVQLLGV